MKPVKIKQSSINRKLTFRNEFGYFSSEKEANRYMILLELEKAGIITNLQCHVSFTLLEAVYVTKYAKQVLKTKAKIIKRKVCAEQAVTLDVSFIYHNKNGRLRVEAVKSSSEYKDPIYVLKRKLMRYLHNIILIEN